MLKQIDHIAVPADKINGTEAYTLTCIRVDTEGMVSISEANVMDESQHSRNGTVLSRVRIGAKTTKEPHGMEDYYHSRTIDELTDILRHGEKDRSDVDAVLALARELMDPQPVDTRRITKYSDEGEELDSDRYLAQDWDAMYRTTRPKFKRTGNKVLDLTFRWGGNCNRSRDEMFTTGAVCIALVSKLEELGYSVGVRGVFASRCHGSRDKAWVECHMKHPGEPLNVELLTSLACHPGVFRWYGVNMNFLTKMVIRGDAGTALYGTEVADMGKRLAETGLIAEPDVAMPELFQRDAARKFLEEFVASMSEAEEELMD